MEDFDRHISDSELLEDFVKRGHEDSFNVLVQDYKLRLFNVAFRVLHDRHAAEDAIQRVFITLLERKDELANVESLQAWLYRTTVNVSLNIKKSRQRREEREKAGETSREAESPREAAAKAELREELDGALGKLKESLRIPVVLRYLQGLSHAETGEILKLSPDAIRMRIGRALKKLRRLLGKRGLLVSTLAVEEGLKTIPAEAASASFLTSASSIIKAASTAGVAAKLAATTTSVITGGLIVTAKTKIAIGVGAAILLAGTATFFATRHRDRERPAPLVERIAASRAARDAADRQKGLIAEKPERGVAATDEEIRQKEGLWGRVVDVQDNGIPEVMVEAGVFEGESPTSLVRKVLVRNMVTDSKGEFWFPEKAAFSPAIQILRRRQALPQKAPGAVHGLLIASKEGYCATRQQVDFESVTGEQKIILREAPVINGRVVWKESKEPIAKGKVVCMPVESDMYQVPKVEAQTDEEGNFNLAISAEGAAKL